MCQMDKVKYKFKNKIAGTTLFNIPNLVNVIPRWASRQSCLVSGQRSWRQNFQTVFPFIFPAGDELHKSLSGNPKGPGTTALWICQSWQSPLPRPPTLPRLTHFPVTSLHKSFQRGSALITGLQLGDLNLTDRQC